VFTAQDLTDLWDPAGGGWLPEQWLSAWREALSGGGVNPEPWGMDLLPLSPPIG
jgi:hypothetical protein